MFSEALNSLKANLYDRIFSPLSGAFITAFLFINYKLVLLIFDSSNYYLKINYIESYLYPDWVWTVFKLAIAPFLSAVAFIVLYPYPARLAYYIWAFQQKKLKEIRMHVEGEQPYSQEKARKLIRDIAVMKADFLKELEEKDEEIEGLRDALSEYEKRESNKATTPQSDDEPNVDHVLLELSNGYGEYWESIDEQHRASILEELSKDRKVRSFLKALAHAGEDVKASEIEKRSSLSSVRAEFIGNALIEAGLISTRHHPVSGRQYSLTSMGKRFTLDYGLAG